MYSLQVHYNNQFGTEHLNTCKNDFYYFQDHWSRFVVRPIKNYYVVSGVKSNQDKAIKINEDIVNYVSFDHLLICLWSSYIKFWFINANLNVNYTFNDFTIRRKFWIITFLKILN